jgi:hypothetical protein
MPIAKGLFVTTNLADYKTSMYSYYRAIDSRQRQSSKEVNPATLYNELYAHCLSDWV